MYSVIGAAVIFAVIGIIWCIKNGEDLRFGLFFGSFVGLIIGVVFATILGSTYPKKYEFIGETPLALLRSGEAIKGSFILGSGSIGEKSYYYFYEQLKGGGYYPGKIENNGHVYIYEEQRENGVLRWFKRVFEDPSNYNYAIYIPDWYLYEFHVPKGTIIKQFQLQ